MSEHAFLAIGSPLVDIIATVDETYLEKYDLKPNDAIAAKDSHKSLFEDLLGRTHAKIQAGGCALNTARTLQWILNLPKTATVLGAIGDDSYGRTLKRQLSEEDVDYVFKVIRNDSSNTGKCAVLLTGDNRSLCTDLGASKFLDVNHLRSPEMWSVVEQARYYYIPGFFLGVSVECIKQVARHSLQGNKVFAFNLSAPFLLQAYGNEISELIPLVDILFGNEAEIRTFANSNSYKNTDLKRIVLFVNGLEKRNSSRERITVVTRGADSVYVAENGAIVEYPVEKLEESKIKDTNAAGDAFVGGFMAGFMAKESLKACVSKGISAAREVIQNIGCSFNEASFLE